MTGNEHGTTAHKPTDLLTTSEVANYLKQSPKTLLNQRCKGDGPAWVRVGKRTVRYRFSDLEAFIAASTAVPA